MTDESAEQARGDQNAGNEGQSGESFPPETHPPYPDSIVNGICVGCGKPMGDVCLCFGCKRRVRALDESGLEQELVKAFTRGLAYEYWARQSPTTTNDVGGEPSDD